MPTETHQLQTEENHKTLTAGNLCPLLRGGTCATSGGELNSYDAAGTDCEDLGNDQQEAAAGLGMAEPTAKRWRGWARASLFGEVRRATRGSQFVVESRFDPVGSGERVLTRVLAARVPGEPSAPRP